MINRLVSVAPMLKCTDKHFRYIVRQLSKHVLLYTEMITTGALLRGDRQRFLAFDSIEAPLALQLGGSDPHDLATCSKMAESYGYDEVNLNVGCPSDTVQAGEFGACLMKKPELVAECVAAMADAVQVPVTVKCRIGVDDSADYDHLADFVSKVCKAGCQTFIVHARKAWLKGLSPKQNRHIPPLRYDIVEKLKREFQSLTIVLNGGIKTVDAIQMHLQHFDGVMVGREIYQNPFVLAEIEQAVFGANNVITPNQIVEAIQPYVRMQLELGVNLASIGRHLMGIFCNKPGGKLWRRYLSENIHRHDADEHTLLAGLKYVA